MELAIVGLGRMGLNMCKRLLRDSHTIHAFARSTSSIAEAVAAGAVGVSRLEDLAKLPTPRIVWVMVPAGKATTDVIERSEERRVGKGEGDGGWSEGWRKS